MLQKVEDRQILYRGSTSGSRKYDDKKHKRGPGDKDDPRNKRKGDKFERVMREDQDPELSHGDSQEAIDGETHTPIQENISEETEVQNGQGVRSEVIPIASFHPESVFKTWPTRTRVELMTYDNLDSMLEDVNNSRAEPVLTQEGEASETSQQELGGQTENK